MATAPTFTEPGTGTEPMPLTDAEVEQILSAPAETPQVPAQGPNGTVPTPGPAPDAPKGYTRDGKPRKRAPRQPRATAPGGPAKRTAPNVKAKPAAVDYEQAAFKLVGLVSMGLVAAAGATRNDAYALDGVAVGAHAGGLAQGVAELAAQSEYVRKGLEWLEKTSPYAALTTALVGVAAQIAVNHGKVAPGAFNDYGITTVDLREQMRVQYGTPAAAPGQ